MPETDLTREVPLPMVHESARLTWVGATTSCLRALGVECDAADVAGHSGYAFALSINGGLCPSGPTEVDWAALAYGPQSLGRSTTTLLTGDCHTDGSRCERTEDHCREVFELVRREVEAGRPCVLWGAGPPEFGAVRGIDGEDYLFVAGGPTPERLAWNAIDAPGGPYALAFPTPVMLHRDRDLTALRRAFEMLTRPQAGPHSRRGLEAYTFWAEELREGRASAFGNSYNAQCWAEARRRAKTFVGRLAERYAREGAPLHRIRRAFDEVSENLDRVAELFPFTKEEGAVADSDRIDSAVAHLEVARAAEQSAIETFPEMPWF